VPGTPAISLVVPAYNEEELLEGTISELSEALRKRQVPFELLVVENGSEDRTLLLAQSLTASVPELRVLSLPEADYGRALRTGLLAAEGPVVVTFDAEYYDFDFLDEAVARITAPEGPVIVVGSKRAKGAQDTRPVHRRAVTAAFSSLLRVAFGLRASDTHGMKALDGPRIRPIAERCQLGRDLFDTELVIRAERCGLPVEELPVLVEERRPSRTSIRSRAVRSLLGLFELRRALRGTSSS
jgi:glycosyltransferase involved in cell wall biosynthesis